MLAAKPPTSCGCGFLIEPRLWSADYYQPFLPNAGNGKRRQRHLREWAGALTDMADRNPEIVLPMHGPAITDGAEAQDRLRAHASILDGVVDQVLVGLNAGLRRQEVADSVTNSSRIRGAR